jgi:hypothetical protein
MIHLYFKIKKDNYTKNYLGAEYEINDRTYSRNYLK